MKRTRRFCDFRAAKSISAYVVFKNDVHIATIRAHYSDSGVCFVECCDMTGKHDLQIAKSPGYGYDGFTAALAGMWVDGHIMTDHCGGSLNLSAEDRRHGNDAPPGYQWANYDASTDSWQDCYRKSGLDYLRAIGFSKTVGQCT